MQAQYASILSLKPNLDEKRIESVRRLLPQFPQFLNLDEKRIESRPLSCRAPGTLPSISMKRGLKVRVAVPDVQGVAAGVNLDEKRIESQFDISFSKFVGIQF